jgi:LacI family transcriptional regulator
VWNSYVVEILRGIDEELAAAEYDLMLYTSRRRAATESAHVATLTQGLAEGLLLLLPRDLGAYIEGLRKRHFPYVLIDHEGSAANGSAVGATNRQGSHDATRHLLELGHRRIGFITGALDVPCSYERLAGYQTALAEGGVASDPSLVVEGNFLAPRAQAATHQLMGLGEPPTAIFASNDISAFGVMQAAREQRLRIPEDLSVIGFDDIPQAAEARPALTTVRQPLEEMGRAAARLLLAAVRDPGREAERIELPTQLIVRGSTASRR